MYQTRQRQYEQQYAGLEQRRVFPGGPERQQEDPYRRREPKEDLMDKINKRLESRKRMKKQQGGE